MYNLKDVLKHLMIYNYHMLFLFGEVQIKNIACISCLEIVDEWNVSTIQDILLCIHLILSELSNLKVLK